MSRTDEAKKISSEEYNLIWRQAQKVKELRKPPKVNDGAWNVLQEYSVIQDFATSFNPEKFAKDKTRDECVQYLLGVDTALLFLRKQGFNSNALAVYRNFISELIACIKNKDELDRDLQLRLQARNQDNEAENLLNEIKRQVGISLENNGITPEEKAFLEKLAGLLHNRSKQDVDLRNEIQALDEAWPHNGDSKFTQVTELLVDEALRLYPRYSAAELAQLSGQSGNRHSFHAAPASANSDPEVQQQTNHGTTPDRAPEQEPSVRRSSVEKR